MRPAFTFYMFGTVADLDDSVPGDPQHPSLVIIVENDCGFLRVVTPVSAWCRPRELLQVGRRLRATCEVRAGLPPVASTIELLDPLH